MRRAVLRASWHVLDPGHNQRVEIHRHPWHELVLVLSGRYRAAWAGGTIDTAAGAALHWPAGCEHRPQPASRACEVLVLQYDQDGPLPGRRPVHVPVAPARLFADAERLHALAEERQPRLRRIANALLDLVLWQLDVGDLGQPPLLRQLRAAVAADRGRRWSLAACAAAVGLSPRHLHRRLLAESGMRPHEAVRRLRVELAMPLLAEGSLSVDAIAARVGFGGRHALARAVRAITGASPRRYRRHAGEAVRG